jgi:hypothetical protein
VIVITPPVFEDNAAFAQGVKEFPIQALRSEPPIEAFRMPVLPGAARVDVDRLDPVVVQPPLDHLGNERRTIVTTDDQEGAEPS